MMPGELVWNVFDEEMKYFTLGWRRLYECVGYTLPVDVEANGSVPIDEFGLVTVYIGKNPKYGSSVPVISGTPTVGVPLTWESVDYRGKVLLELTVSHRRELSSQLETLLKVQDQSTVTQLLETVKDGEPHRQVLDALAGSIGILIEKQMVIRPVAEGGFIEYKGIWSARSNSNAFDIAESINMTDSAVSPLKSILDLFARLPSESIAAMGDKLHWLLKAWVERDPIAKFVYSFIPLEALLPRGSADVFALTSLARLRSIVSAAGDKTDDLELFLNLAEKKFGSSLVDRFGVLASTHDPEGWESDYKVFKVLNRRRNTLLHQGGAKVDFGLLESQTKALQDLSIKYIKKIYYSTV